MATIRIGINEAEFADIKRSLSHREIVKARRATVAETKRHVRTLLDREIRAELNIKLKDLREILTVRGSGDVGEVILKHKPIPLIDLGARQTRAGVTVKARKRGRRELLRPATFIAKMKSGHIGVFERRLKGNVRPRGRGKRVGRLKIDERYGPTALAYINRKPGLLSKILADASEFMAQRYFSKLTFAAGGGSFEFRQRAA